MSVSSWMQHNTGWLGGGVGVTSWRGDAPSKFVSLRQTVETTGLGNSCSRGDANHPPVDNCLVCFTTCHVTVTLFNVPSEVTSLKLCSLLSWHQLKNLTKPRAAGSGFNITFPTRWYHRLNAAPSGRPVKVTLGWVVGFFFFFFCVSFTTVNIQASVSSERLACTASRQRRGVGGSASRAGLDNGDAQRRTSVPGDVPRLALRARALLPEHHQAR